MTRVICVAPLIDSARLFMQSELGWEIEERDELGAMPTRRLRSSRRRRSGRQSSMPCRRYG